MCFVGRRPTSGLVGHLVEGFWQRWFHGTGYEVSRFLVSFFLGCIVSELLMAGGKFCYLFSDWIRGIISMGICCLLHSLQSIYFKWNFQYYSWDWVNCNANENSSSWVAIIWRNNLIYQQKLTTYLFVSFLSSILGHSCLQKYKYSNHR